MNTHRRLRLLAAGLSGAVGLLGISTVLSPVVALAQERTTSTTRPPYHRPPREGDRAAAMDEVKSRCLHEIERRQNDLSAAKRRLAQAEPLTDAHEGALVQNIDATSASLSRLADAIQAEDNFEELRAECRSIVVDHRVYVLVIPRARLVALSDAELAAAAKLTELAAKLQSRIDQAKAEGKDTAEAEADLARMRGHVQAARDYASGVYDSVIGITPAQYNANNQILDGPRQAVRAARDELQAAVEAAKEVRQDLGSD